jgi:hypothetical protein
VLLGSLRFLPRHANQHITDRRDGNPELCGQGPDGHSSFGVSVTDHVRSFASQDGAVVMISTDSILSIASLGVHISDVFGLSANGHVSGPNTKAVVASVQNDQPVWYGSDEPLVGPTVSGHQSASRAGGRKEAVLLRAASAARGGSPYPATIPGPLVYLGPEACVVIHGHKVGNNRLTRKQKGALFRADQPIRRLPASLAPER